MKKLEWMELAIANYNAQIRALKRQMPRRRGDPSVTRKAIALYQQFRDDLDVQLGLERLDAHRR
jgi:hypothetical protein